MKPFDSYDGEQEAEYDQMRGFIDGHEGPQARLIGDWLHRELMPVSVIDIGCSTGIYLAHFYNEGCDIFGLDAVPNVGSFFTEEQKREEGIKFIRWDLRFPYFPEEKYGLVICLEVAEHLPETFSTTLVDTICGCAADTVLFTGATPGQGGSFHLNEQPHSYWLEKFAARGFHLHPLHNAFRAFVNSQPDAYPGLNPPEDAPLGCTGWMKNNSFLLKNEESNVS